MFTRKKKKKKDDSQLRFYWQWDNLLKDNPTYSHALYSACVNGEIEESSQGELFRLIQRYISFCVNQSGQKLSLELERLSFDDWAGIYTLMRRYVTALEHYIALVHIPAISQQPVQELSNKIVEHGIRVLEEALAPFRASDDFPMDIPLKRLQRTLSTYQQSYN